MAERWLNRQTLEAAEFSVATNANRNNPSAVVIIDAEMLRDLLTRAGFEKSHR